MSIKKNELSEAGTILRFALTASTPAEVDREIDQDLPLAHMLREAGAYDLDGIYHTDQGEWAFTFRLVEFTPGAFLRNLVSIWSRTEEHVDLHVQLHMAWVDDGDAGLMKKFL